MDVRSSERLEPTVMHESVRVWELVPKFSVREETKGTYLEAIVEFEIAAGARAEPHHHDTHEYYFILEGEAVVQIEDEARRVRPKDLVYIPPGADHTIWPTGETGVRSLAFAASYQEPVLPGYIPAELPEPEPTGQARAPGAKAKTKQ